MKSRKHISASELSKSLKIDFSPSQIINFDIRKIDELSKQIESRTDFSEYQREKWNNPLFWNRKDSIKNRSQYFTIGNSINFRYWQKSRNGIIPLRGKKRGEEFGGALYMWRCLQICLEEELFPILDASFLANITKEQFNKIFSTDLGENLLSVAIDNRIRNLQNLGSRLLAKWEGAFFNLVVASANSPTKFCQLSREFIAFNDPLYKLTMVNTIFHVGSGIVAFDADPLPGIDYQLMKQLLRIGILLPNHELKSKLTSQKILSKKESYEIRRMALHAFVILSENTAISGEILDNKFWWNRRKCLDINPVCVNPETASECPFFGTCNQRLEFTIPLEVTRYY